MHLPGAPPGHVWLVTAPAVQHIKRSATHSGGLYYLLYCRCVISIHFELIFKVTAVLIVVGWHGEQSVMWAHAQEIPRSHPNYE